MAFPPFTCSVLFHLSHSTCLSLPCPISNPMVQGCPTSSLWEVKLQLLGSHQGHHNPHCSSCHSFWVPHTPFGFNVLPLPQETSNAAQLREVRVSPGCTAEGCPWEHALQGGAGMPAHSSGLWCAHPNMSCRDWDIGQSCSAGPGGVKLTHSLWPDLNCRVYGRPNLDVAEQAVSLNPWKLT